MKKKDNYIGKRKNLVRCKGMQFSAKIYGDTVNGIVHYGKYNGEPIVFLLQNEHCGGGPDRGFLSLCRKYDIDYSWMVDRGSLDDLLDNNVTHFRLLVDEE